MISIKKAAQWLLLLVLLLSCARAEEFKARVPTNRGVVEIASTVIEKENWLFLPSHVEMEELTLYRADGDEVPFTQQTVEEGVLLQTEEGILRVMSSDHIRSLFLFSDDPIHQGRTYIDKSEDHATSTTASMVLVGADGTIDHSGRISKLRGRGNGTWQPQKKPYQFKLEEKMDLLDTGDQTEKNRTWVLLAMALDSTCLHDRMTFDLARELGDHSTSGSEHVNLYYDGEYRGLYLLCEKTEINPGRIEELDYDEIIETLGRQRGQYDLENLSSTRARNRFENEFTYLKNVPETDDPGAGAFLLEMENEWLTLSDPCWFRLADNSVFACKNPEKASESMMRYISERLQEARNTLENRGINPQNGRTLADDFDIEDFARLVLISELSGTPDSWVHSSTFLILPAGETRFQAGPVWDYDMAYRYPSSSTGVLDATGLRDKTGWIPLFLSCPDFVKEVKRICEDSLAPLVRDILLGQQQGTYLRPIDDYVAEIDTAMRMNAKLWPAGGATGDFSQGDAFEQAIKQMKQFLHERSEWLFEMVAGWDVLSPDAVELWADCAYVHIDGNLRLVTRPWVNARVRSCTYEQIAEATEEDYALWRLDAVIEPLEGFAFANPSVTVNGTSVECKLQGDGTIALSFLFEDPSYRPVDAWGEDIGLVYDYETYIRHYPEVAEACEYDPEMVMEYFLYEGMYEGHQANSFFEPSKILFINPDLELSYGEDWWLYYTDYIAFGWMEWKLSPNARFDLKVLPLL